MAFTTGNAPIKLAATFSAVSNYFVAVRCASVGAASLRYTVQSLDGKTQFQFGSVGCNARDFEVDGGQSNVPKGTPLRFTISGDLGIIREAVGIVTTDPSF
ncbi:hypothetical protein [Gryllotalpicola sp.]|uniref:hypothetical protein n=1 Tax=Gryllotalpicola sp. TaxID=1932787 RepID=UPI00263449B4|nr:hypothetical protein [Gryllotalpicola sp.]